MIEIKDTSGIVIYTSENAKNIEQAVREALEKGADLRYADLTGSNFTGANFRYADFRYADFRYADFTGADLRYADLTGSNFTGADFTGADFTGADLRGADFTGADLRGADLDYSCWPLWCGSVNVTIDRKQFIQLLYHIISAGESVDDEDIKKLVKNRNILKLLKEFHHFYECERKKKL